MISGLQLQQIVPACRDYNDWSQVLTGAFDDAAIISPEAAAAFLGQIAVESAELNRLEENLNYSAPRLCAVWPSRFPTLADAEPYARNPEKLGNKVYANRLGNGDEASGDGYRYRGRGLMQTTGRANYAALEKATGMPVVSGPDMLLQKKYAARAATYFWMSHNLNDLADGTVANFEKITRIINGGTHGLEERKRYWARARKALGAA